MRRFFGSAIVMFIVCNAFGQACFSTRYIDTIVSDLIVYEDLKYATVDPYGILPSQDLHLDFYEPFGDTVALRPLIIFSPGGAFIIGDKKQPFIPDFCRYFAKRGYATAAINYRLGYNSLDQGSVERAVYRATQDIRAAMRFLAENAAIFRIDTTNIFLAGTSAGCVASMHNAFMTENDRPASTYGTLLEPTDLGCGNCSGNNYYNNQTVRIKGIINCWGAILDTNYITDVASDSIPIISFHGTNDLIVPYGYGNPFQLPIFPPTYGSQPIHQRLDNLGIFNKLRPFKGAGHEPELLNNWAYADSILAETTPFLFEIIKPGQPSVNGDTIVSVNDTVSYTVDVKTGYQYCWEITGGDIISQLADRIEVLWTDTGQQQIEVKAINTIRALGDYKQITVDVLPLAITKIITENIQGHITLYPNPAQEALFVKNDLKNQAPFKVELFSISGEKVFQTIIDRTNKIDLGNLAGGIYNLKITIGDHSVVKKIVKL